MSVFLLILGIVLFIGLILIHEWGHFIAARRGGVEVEEYGIFFPPTLYKRKMKGGWNFTINALPLGGFVKLKGEHDTDTEPGSYGAASLKTKSKIMLAGVFMNLVTAYVILLVLCLVGVPKLIDNQFTIKSDTKTIAHAQHMVRLDSIEKNSPGAKAGLRADDTIKAIGPVGDKQAINSVTSLQKITKKFAGQQVVINYQRGTKQLQATTTLNSVMSQQTAHPTGYLGVSIDEVQQGSDLQRSTWSAPIVAGGLLVQFTQLTFVHLGYIFSGLGSLIAGTATHNTVARQHGQTSAGDQVGGPVLIVYALHLLSSLGYQFILFIIALVSLTLAIMNFLPIPALDGGKFWITLISRGIFKKPLKPRTEELVNGIAFVVLIGLSILIAFLDVHRITSHTL